MAINQAEYNQIQDQFRERYILQKDREIQNVITTYYGAMKYVIERFLASPYATLPRVTDPLIRDINTAIEQTKPVIENTFRGGLTNMYNVGSDSVVMPLAFFSANTTPLVNRIAERRTPTIQTFLERKGVSDRSISENIWNIDRKSEIFKIIDLGQQLGDSPFKTAEKLEEYSIKGNGFSNSYRLSYTEYTHAHSKSQIDAVRDWNEEGSFKILIEQYLSSGHMVYCICDILAGFYDPSKPVPKIPRHPNCNCGQRQFIQNTENIRRISSISEKVRQAEMGKDVRVLKDLGVANATPGKGLVAQSENKWNAQLEYITRNLKGAEQKAALQALANTVDLNDPLGSKVGGLLDRIYGVKRQDSTTSPLSSSNVKKKLSEVLIGNNKLDLDQKEVDFINSRGIKILTKPRTADEANSLGAFDVLSNSIYVNPDKYSPETFKTFLHEFGHAIDANLGSVGSTKDRQYLSLRDTFVNAVSSKTGLTRDGQYIVTKRALGLQGEGGEQIQRYIMGITPYNELPQQLRQTASNFQVYYQTPQEMFAEAYMLYRTDPNFRDLAPDLYRYFQTLNINI